MRVLENLEPKKVFYYFEELCNIPHGSGNVEAISDYLKDFAQERNLEVIQDEVKNIIIITTDIHQVKNSILKYQSTYKKFLKARMTTLFMHFCY